MRIPNIEELAISVYNDIEALKKLPKNKINHDRIQELENLLYNNIEILNIIKKHIRDKKLNEINI